MSSDEESLSNGNRLIISDAEDEPNIIEDLQENEENNEVQRDEEGDNAAEGDKTTVKPKRVIRNPQPKLNHETLKGPRGIAAIESYFERVKFKGKGHEHQDLNVVMKTYEYWCHRLFPKFPFDTCIERLEKLGTKRAVQTHIKKIRFDLLVEDKPIIDSSDEENNVDGFVNIQNEEIDQQNQQFDQLLATRIQPASAELSEEQLERIRLNKERAEKLKQERLKKIREKAQENLEISSPLPGTSGIDLDSQSMQSDVLSQDIQTITSEGIDFDLESNVKGKATIRGSAIKKKSSKHVNNDIADTEECSNDSTFHRKSKNTRLIDSDSDEDNLVIFQVDHENSNDEPTQSKNMNSRYKNVIESYEEMGEISQKESDPNDTHKVYDNESHQELGGNTAITTENGLDQMPSGGNDQMEIVEGETETDLDSTENTRVKSKSAHQKLESNTAAITKAITTENGIDQMSSGNNDQMDIVEEETETDLDSTETTAMKTKSDNIRDLENKENSSVDNIC